MVVVPVVNVDGYSAIGKNYQYTQEFSYVRKNMHVYDEQRRKCGDALSNGVDLKRNYAYKFAYDEVGSSSDPCSDDYRGPSAFSEPETAAIRDLVQNWPNFKAAINL